MSEIIKKKERYAFLIEELTSLEVKLSLHLEDNPSGDNSVQKNILEKDIAAIKEELDELSDINAQFKDFIKENEEKLKYNREYKDYFSGIEKVNEELNSKIKKLKDLLESQKSLQDDFEEFLKNGNISKEKLNNKVNIFKEAISKVSSFEISDGFKELKEDDLENWQSFQHLLDTKEEIDEIINNLIGQKMELNKLKEEFILEKMEE